jgi:DNA-binding CsgD family transcriptional regulator/tetratricopeptide (TPR) repeat protein
VLTGGSRTALPRYRTLRGAVEWSYTLLDTEEQTLLRRLAVFAGGFTLEAAERVASGELRVGSEESRATHHSLLATLVALVDKSLVQVDTESGPEPRHRLLEMIRQYGLDRLREAGEEIETRRRHLAWYARLPSLGRTILHSPDGPARMAQLGTEIDNLRAALAWSASDDDARSARTGLMLATGLYGFWFGQFKPAEGYLWHERTLAADEKYPRTEDDQTPDDSGGQSDRAGTTGTHPRVAALNQLSNLAEDVWSQEEAFRRSEETLSLARAVGDRLGEVHALIQFGNYARRYGQLERAARLYEEALPISRECGDSLGLWRALRNLGIVAILVGNTARASPLIEECLAIARSTGSIWGQAEALRLLGDLALRDGDLEGAIRHLEGSLGLLEQLCARRGRTWTLLTLGRVYLARGEIQRAAGCFSEGVVACHEAGDRPGMARSLEGLATAATSDRKHETVACTDAVVRLLAAAAALREASTSPIALPEQPERDRTLDATRALLGDASFSAAWELGRAMPLRQVVDLGVELARTIERDHAAPATGAAPASSVPAHLAPLTPREREVAILVGRGHTNRQIAEQMVVSERTVEVYARNIRERLGLSTRAQMVAWMIQHGLTDSAG